MSCNVNSTGGKMKAFVAEMVFAISNEHTRSRPEGKFGGVIWLEKWPAFTIGLDNVEDLSASDNTEVSELE
jgi:hypothetical protein